MGFFDSAQDMFDKGASAAKGAVSGVAVEQQAFAKGFARLAEDAWALGWHERNGGNLSYRLTVDEVAWCRSFFYDNPSSWAHPGVQVPKLGGEYLLVTASGSAFRNVAGDLSGNAGIIELDPTGSAWRIVWGFKNGGMPTSELAAHLVAHEVRRETTGGATRVVYHAHPTQIVAMTQLVPADSRLVTRALWKAFLESMVAFPQGIAVLPWAVPGGAGIAQATGEALADCEACVWALHGALSTGADFDAALGLMHTIEKAAGIYNQARAANGGSDDFPNVIPDDDLRAVAQTYGLSVRAEYLE